jgi:hypothetical protein
LHAIELAFFCTRYRALYLFTTKESSTGDSGNQALQMLRQNNKRWLQIIMVAATWLLVSVGKMYLQPLSIFYGNLLSEHPYPHAFSFFAFSNYRLP